MINTPLVLLLAAVAAADTPGVHLHHRIPHMLTPAELRLLHPRKRLMAFSPPSPLDILRAQEEEEDQDADYVGSSNGRADASSSSSSSNSKPKSVTASYIWSGLVRVDVLSGPPSCSLAFYGPRSMRVYALPLLAAGQEVDFKDDCEDEEEEYDEFLQELLEEQQQGEDPSSSSSSSTQKASKGSSVLFCKESVEARGGLVPHSFVVKSPIPTAACLADVAVSGLPGWIGVYAPFSKQDIVLRVWVPRGVEVFLRPPLPCPPPPKPQGSEEPEELLEVGQTLAAAEADQEWEAYRSGLGLKPLSGEDEEVVRLLLFGSEAAGLQGIVDAEEDGWEDEGEIEQQDGEDGSDGEAAEEVLLAPPVARAEEVLGSSSSSSLQGRRRRTVGTAAQQGSCC
jgi:nitric-oxide synthase